MGHSQLLVQLREAADRVAGARSAFASGERRAALHRRRGGRETGFLSIGTTNRRLRRQHGAAVPWLPPLENPSDPGKIREIPGNVVEIRQNSARLTAGTNFEK